MRLEKLRRNSRNGLLQAHSHNFKDQRSRAKGEATDDESETVWDTRHKAGKQLNLTSNCCH